MHLDLKYAWIIAAWKPDFSDFLNQYVLNELNTRTEAELIQKDDQMGDAMVAAIKSGLKIKGVKFNKGSFLDIGTPDDLKFVETYLGKNNSP